MKRSIRALLVITAAAGLVRLATPAGAKPPPPQHPHSMVDPKCECGTGTP
jgi:hypothetical protein